eukprot:scaffold10585_cov122-Isochrysis_galbana.AAC.2
MPYLPHMWRSLARIPRVVMALFSLPAWREARRRRATKTILAREKAGTVPADGQRPARGGGCATSSFPAYGFYFGHGALGGSVGRRPGGRCRSSRAAPHSGSRVRQAGPVHAERPAPAVLNRC